MAEEYEAVAFAACDVDEVEDVAARCQISAMPTIQFYRNGEKVKEVMGANEQAIREALKTYA